MPLGRLVLVAGMALGLLTGTAQAGALPPLSRGLLTAADLPKGYYARTAEYQAYSASSNPACSKTMDELEFSTPRFRGVEYARAGFAKSDLGPWILENLRRYPNEATADHDFTRILNVLSGCSTFSQTYTGRDPAVITVTLTPIRMAKVGSRSKAIWVTAKSNGRWAYGEILMLARVRGTFMILSQLGFKRPSPNTAQAIADRAGAKMRKVAG
ncbi:hypothetical protein AB0392_06955 [Nonomuraea angiospora]|uniref:hypothetical protein n=1 Tax=Nonomuraea angiospora TaxID=46172 RepID=UPI00344CEE4F